MHTVKLADAPFYSAPGHSGMLMQRLQGMDAGPSDSVWIGLSVVEPGGGTTLTAAAVEKFYVVVEGTVQISTQEPGSATSLGYLDSCRIAPGESRQISNLSAHKASLLLVMPLPK